MSELTPSQTQVVMYDRDCLVYAGPGSGKTKVLVEKAKRILKADSGARILIVTFTKEAATNVRNRILKGLPERDAARVASGTFHSIAYSQLQNDGFNGTVIGAGTMREYIKRAVLESRVTMDIDAAIASIEYAKQTPNYEPANDEAGKLYVAYELLTRRNNVIDFQDMLARTVRMMDSEGLAPKKCTHLFVDEFQDIDQMQYVWIALHLRAGAVLTGIGDDDQSIYMFRQALGFKGMEDMGKEFNAVTFTLDDNFRSHFEIVHAAGKVISKNTARQKKTINATRGPGGNVQYFKYSSYENEIHGILEEIKNTCPVVTEKGKTEYRIEEGQWAILSRNKKALHGLSGLLKAHNIPYVAPGGSMWEASPVCLALNLLWSLMPKEVQIEGKKEAHYQKAGYDQALAYAGVDEATLQELHDEYGDDFAGMLLGKPDFSKFSAGTKAVLEEFSKQCRYCQREAIKGRDGDRVNNAINGVFGWFKTYRDSMHHTSAKHKRSDGEEIDLLNLAQVILMDMKGSLATRLHCVMGNVDQPEKDKKQKEAEDKEKKGKIILSTVHASKGLEYTNVWMMSLDEGIFPTDTEKNPLTDETLPEERRLFYVGMTRAKDNLYLSTSGKPSIFLDETGIKPIHVVGKGSIDENKTSAVAC